MASGQSINFQKSSVTFSPNVTEEKKDVIQGVLGLCATQPHERYSAFPTLVGRNKKQTFRVIKERVGKNYSNGGVNFFSQGEKEILIKVVVLAISNYTTSVFRLPDTLCYELHQLAARI